MQSNFMATRKPSIKNNVKTNNFLQIYQLESFCQHIVTKDSVVFVDKW